MVELYDWEQVHAQIVRETFVSLDREHGVALIGILNEYKIEYSDELRAVVEPVEHGAPWYAQALTPEYAASLVGAVFGYDPWELLGSYRDSWRVLRRSGRVRSLTQALEQHRFIGRLLPASDVP